MSPGKLIIYVAASGLVWAGFPHSCLADPPASTGAWKAELSMSPSFSLGRDAGRIDLGTEAPSAARPSAPLDLRPPDPTQHSQMVPAMMRPHPVGSESHEGQRSGPLSADRPLSPAEELLRRAQREGLPLARLFESQSALISLGLNKKGKPGLWLVEKFH
jgi:hypothetical protein